MAGPLCVGRSLYLFPFLQYVFFCSVVTDAPPSNTRSKENKTCNRNNKLKPGLSFLKKPLCHDAYIQRKSVLDTAWSGDVLHFHGYICSQTILASSPSGQTSGSTLLLPVLSPAFQQVSLCMGLQCLPVSPS